MEFPKTTKFKTIQKEYPDAISINISGFATVDAIRRLTYGEAPARLLQSRHRIGGVTYVFSKQAAQSAN